MLPSGLPTGTRVESVAVLGMPPGRDGLPPLWRVPSTTVPWRSAPRLAIMQYTMARTTSDPKARTLAIRISEDDAKKLTRLAKVNGTSKGAVIRRLIRESAALLDRPPRVRTKVT